MGGVLATLLAACENPQPPGLCGAIPEQTVVVGETASVTACFDDPNGDLLSYSVSSSDPGVATASIAGTLVTVKGAAPGVGGITITATDAGGLTALNYTLSVSDTEIVGFSSEGPVATLEARAKGTVTVTATATDPGDLSATQAFVVTVPNRGPELVGSIPEQTVEVGANTVIDVTGYFSDPDGDDLAYAATTSAAVKVEVAVSGTDLRVVAVARGSATISVTATDTEGLVATQAFVVTAPNQAPVATREIEARTVEVGETTDLELSSYFSDPDDDALAYMASVSDPRVVEVAVSGGAFTATAVAKGTASVTVTATDTDGLGVTLAFDVTVPNRSPVATGEIEARTIEVGETATLDLSGHFSDPDGDVLEYVAVSSDREVADIDLAGSVLTVMAAAKGVASVTLTATDMEGLVVTQAFAIIVPNQPPVATGSIELRILEVGATANLGLPGHFSDPDGDVLAYAATTSDAGKVEVAVSGADLTVAAVARGGATVSVTATDTEGLVATQSFAVTVPNQPPVATGQIEARTVEVGETAELELSSYFSDPDGDGLAYTASVSDTGVLGVSVSGGVFTATAVAKGTVSVSVTATDSDGFGVTLAFDVTVPNRSPVATGEIAARTVEVGETEAVDLSAHFSEPDGDVLAYAAASSDTEVAGVGIAGSVLTVPAVAKGVARVTVTATDTEGLVATQAFAVTVPNQPPAATGSIEARTLEAGATADLGLSAHFTDPDGDVMAYSATTTDADVAEASISGSDLTVASIAKGEATISVAATDTEGLVATLAFAVTVPNQPPVATIEIEARTVQVGETAGFELSSHFTDPDGDDIAYAATTSNTEVADVSVSGGMLSVVAVARGTADITVTATDAAGLSVTRGFAVIVPNRPPHAFGEIPDMRVTEGSVKKIDPSSLFSDPDEDALVFEALSSSPQVARVWVSGERVLVRALKDGTATIAVIAEDPEGLEASQRFEVRVDGSTGSGSNQAPKVAGTVPTQQLAVDGSSTLNAASYFTDPDDDPLVFTTQSSDTDVVTAAASGTEVRLAAVAEGTATVTITAKDPDGLRATLNFGVTVSVDGGPNRAPVVVGQIRVQRLEVGDARTLNAASHFTDPDNDDLVFSAQGSDSDVVTIDVAGNEVTLSAVAEGTATVSITALDPDGLEAAQDFTVTVAPAGEGNRPPAVIGQILAQELEEGDKKMVDAGSYFTDPDHDELEFAAESSDTEVVEVTTSGNEVELKVMDEGETMVTVIARDPEGLEATQDFPVVARAELPNQPPQVKRVPSWDSRWSDPVLEDVTLEVVIADLFHDPDDDYSSLIVTAESTDETVVRIESTNSNTVELLTVSPGQASVTVTVIDPEGASASKTWGVTVGNVAPEVWSEGKDFVMAVGEETGRYFGFYLVDCNIGDSLTFTLSNSNPTVVKDSVDGVNAYFKGLTTGTTTITMTAVDKAGLTAEVSYVITVDNNRAPIVIDSISKQITVTKGDTLRFVLTDHFEDPDGDKLKYSVAAHRGLNKKIRGDTLWVMAVGVGRKHLLVTARDPEGRQVSQSSTVTVEDPQEDSQLVLSVDSQEQPPGPGPWVVAASETVRRGPARSGPREWPARGRAPSRRSGAVAVDSG